MKFPLILEEYHSLFIFVRFYSDCNHNTINTD
jgi:hypothetical protein